MVAVDCLNLFMRIMNPPLSRMAPDTLKVWPDFHIYVAPHAVCTSHVESSCHPMWHCLLLSLCPCCSSTFCPECLSLTVQILLSILQSYLLSRNLGLPPSGPLCKIKKMPATQNLAKCTAGSCVWGPGGRTVAHLNLGEGVGLDRILFFSFCSR